MQIELSELLNLLSQQRATESPAPQSSGTDIGQRIVVLDRGFVYVGNVVIRGEFVHISNAQNIRIWGTTKGLGELRDGPLSGTKLDFAGEIIAPLKSVIHFIAAKGF